MTRVMYDSVTSHDIPAGAQMVAGYVDGAYAWSLLDWELHLGATKVRITVTGATLDAHVADVETGDLTPALGAEWGRRMLAAGKYPVLYFSLGLWPQVKAAIEAAGLQTGQFGAWVALWDGVAQLQPGWLAKQYAHPPGSGGHYDLSVVADYWGGVDPAPAKPPPPVVIPPEGFPPPDSPPPSTSNLPPNTPPIDQTRSAWADLAAFLTQDLPGFVAELLRLLGILKRTP